jgi:hypothetical protein
VLTIHDVLWVVLLPVPKDPDMVAPVHDELIPGVDTVRVISNPPSQVLLLREWVNARRTILLLDATFPSVTINIGELVDGDGVLLVEGSAVEGFGGGDGLLGRLIFHKGEARCGEGESVSYRCVIRRGRGPFRHALVSQRHEDGIFPGLARRVEPLQQKLEKSRLAVLRHHRQPIDDDECVKTLF